MWLALALAGSPGTYEAAAREPAPSRGADRFPAPLPLGKAGSDRDSERRGRGTRSTVRVIGIVTMSLGGAAAAVGGSLAASSGAWWTEQSFEGGYVSRGEVIFAADAEAASELRRRRRAQSTGLTLFAVGIAGLAVGTTLTTVEPTSTGTGVLIRTRWSTR